MRISLISSYFLGFSVFGAGVFTNVLEVSLLVFGSYERLLIISSTLDFGVSATALATMLASSGVILLHLERIDCILAFAIPYVSSIRATM